MPLLYYRLSSIPLFILLTFFTLFLSRGNANKILTKYIWLIIINLFIFTLYNTKT